jgi:type IV secretory pathway VirB4 component
MTGIRKTSDMNKEQDAAIKRYRNTLILDYLLVSDSVMIASVELFKASNTLLRQFFITKSTEAWSSLTVVRSRVEILKALTMISMIASHMLRE